MLQIIPAPRTTGKVMCYCAVVLFTPVQYQLPLQAFKVSDVSSITRTALNPNLRTVAENNNLREQIRKLERMVCCALER